MRRADVGQNQAEDVFVHAAVDQHPRRRDDQALLEDLLEQADAARRAAADVDVMGQGGGVGHQVIAVVNRRQQAHVIEVQAAEVAIVAQDAVAGPQAIAAVDVDDARDEVDQRAEVDGLGEGLRDDAREIDDQLQSDPTPWTWR